MKKYLYKLFLFSFPIFLLFGLFLVLDPFAMVHGGLKGFVVSESANDDYNTFHIFDKHNDSLKYNAFLMGNSKTLGILSTDWKSYIGSEQKVYKFGGPGESILNIRKKLEYVVRKGNNLDFVIILLDNKLLSNTDNSSPDLQGPVYLKGPKSSNNSILNFAMKGFYYFLKNGYFFNYFNYKISNNYQKISASVNKSEINDFAYTNEFFKNELEKKIQEDSSSWSKKFNYNIGKKNKVKKINLQDSIHLNSIKELFDQKRTEYKIVFVPDYDCSYEVDILVIQDLKRLFKDTCVFIGYEMLEICENPYYFYDQTHFRPIVGKMLLEKMYKINAK